MLWQVVSGERREVTVRGASQLGVPEVLEILASVSEHEDLRVQGRCYIQLSVPGLGPVLAWVGLPGGGQRDGCFVHPRSGKTWKWGELRQAVKFAADFEKI